MLLKVVFAKTDLVKFTVSNNLKQGNTFKTTKNPKESPYKPLNFKNLKKKIGEPKVSRLLPNVCYLQNESNTLRYGLKNKNYRKSIDGNPKEQKSIEVRKAMFRLCLSRLVTV
jgi:hypothetical protein